MEDVPRSFVEHIWFFGFGYLMLSSSFMRFLNTFKQSKFLKAFENGKTIQLFENVIFRKNCWRNIFEKKLLTLSWMKGPKGWEWTQDSPLLFKCTNRVLTDRVDLCHRWPSTFMFCLRFEGQSIFVLKILDCLLSLETFIEDRPLLFWIF